MHAWTARSLLLLVTAPEAEDLLDVSVEDQPKLVTQAQRFSAADLLRAIELISDALAEMRNTPDHRLLLEVALVRAAAPETDPGTTGLLGRIERLERRMGIEGAEAPSEVRQTAVEERPAKSARALAGNGRVAASTSSREGPQSGPPGPTTAIPHTGSETSSSVPTGPQGSSTVGLGHVRGAWDATVVEVNKRSKRVGAFLNPSRPLQFDDDQLIVEVQSKFHADEMGAEKNLQIFADALHAALGVRPQIAFVARGEVVTGAADEPSSSPSSGSTGPSAGGFVGEPLSDIEEDPIELVKKGFAAQVVEEKSS